MTEAQAPDGGPPRRKPGSSLLRGGRVGAKAIVAIAGGVTAVVAATLGVLQLKGAFDDPPAVPLVARISEPALRPETLGEAYHSTPLPVRCGGQGGEASQAGLEITLTASVSQGQARTNYPIEIDVSGPGPTIRCAGSVVLEPAQPDGTLFFWTPRPRRPGRYRVTAQIFGDPGRRRVVCRKAEEFVRRADGTVLVRRVENRPCGPTQ